MQPQSGVGEQGMRGGTRPQSARVSAPRFAIDLSRVPSVAVGQETPEDVEERGGSGSVTFREFKLQWPTVPFYPDRDTLVRPMTARPASSRIDDAEKIRSPVRPTTAYPSGSRTARPWSSNPRSRIISRRTAPQHQGNLGFGRIGSSVETEDAEAAKKANSIRSELLENHRKEVKEYRGKLFNDPKKNFTRQDMNDFCLKLLGDDEIARARKVCRKIPDERSYEDCQVLYNVAAKSGFLREKFTRQQIMMFFRCAHMETLKAGERFRGTETDDRMALVIRGLISADTPGMDSQILKDGSVFCKLRQSGVSSPLSQSSFRRKVLSSFRARGSFRALDLTPKSSPRSSRHGTPEMPKLDYPSETHPEPEQPTAALHPEQPKRRLDAAPPTNVAVPAQAATPDPVKRGQSFSHKAPAPQEPATPGRMARRLSEPAVPITTPRAEWLRKVEPRMPGVAIALPGAQDASSSQSQPLPRVDSDGSSLSQTASELLGRNGSCDSDQTSLNRAPSHTLDAALRGKLQDADTINRLGSSSDASAPTGSRRASFDSETSSSANTPRGGARGHAFGCSPKPLAPVEAGGLEDRRSKLGRAHQIPPLIRAGPDSSSAKPVEHKAMKACEVLVLSKAHLRAHVDACQGEIRGPAWLLVPGTDGSSPGHWTKVTCQIEEGFLLLGAASKNATAATRKELSTLTVAEPVDMDEAGGRYQAAMVSVGIDNEGLFRLHFENAPSQSSTTTQSAASPHKPDAPPTSGRAPRSRSIIAEPKASDQTVLKALLGQGSRRSLFEGSKQNLTVNLLDPTDKPALQPTLRSEFSVLMLAVSSAAERAKWLESMQYFLVKKNLKWRPGAVAGTEGMSQKDNVVRGSNTSDPSQMPKPTPEDLMVKALHQQYEHMMSNRFCEIASYLGSLALFKAWSWREAWTLAQSVVVQSFVRGQTIFSQDTLVKGLYVVRFGSANLVHLEEGEEQELRFPGREDLVMEEDLEVKRLPVVRRVDVGNCGESSVFGEERASNSAAQHRFSLQSDTYAVVLFIPWEALQDRVEGGKGGAIKTLSVLSRNDANRSVWINKRVRHVKASRFFVDITKHRHLNENAFVMAANSVQRLMTLEAAIVNRQSTGNQVQHFDVEAAESAARKASESLDALYRSSRTPGQMNHLRRVIGVMRDELRQMLGQIQEAFALQMHDKIKTSTGRKALATAQRRHERENES